MHTFSPRWPWSCLHSCPPCTAHARKLAIDTAQVHNVWYLHSGICLCVPKHSSHLPCMACASQIIWGQQPTESSALKLLMPSSFSLLRVMYAVIMGVTNTVYGAAMMVLLIAGMPGQALGTADFLMDTLHHANRHQEPSHATCAHAPEAATAHTCQPCPAACYAQLVVAPARQQTVQLSRKSLI